MTLKLTCNREFNKTTPPKATSRKRHDGTAANGLHFFVLSNNGQLISKLDLGGSTVASPAVAADKVYVSTDVGLYSFTWDLNSFTRDGTARGGFSSPAIGKDGTVYMVTSDGQLRAYQGR